MQGMVAKKISLSNFYLQILLVSPSLQLQKCSAPPLPPTFKNGLPPQSNANHTFHRFIAWSLRNKLLTNILDAVPLCPRSCPTLPQELSQFTPGVDDISQKKFKISFK